MQIVSDPAERLSRWLEAEAGIADARIVRRLTGGNANVTSLVESASGPMVLRHPPADTVSDLAGAGIAREFRFISAIAGKAPVAEPILFCDDSEVLGAPFSLTRFVRGAAITDTLPAGYADDVATRDAVGHALIDAIASVHAIKPVPEGLGDADKARNFVSRQIERWRGVRAAHAVRDLPLIETLGAWLADNAPAPEAVRIVHCDYHLDNVLMDLAEPKVLAILDWEMATLADPLVDVGLVTAMWNRDENLPLGFAFVQRVSNVAGVVGGADLARRWANATGLSIDRLGYFQAFALWRLAAIVEGAYVLFREGQVDGPYERGLEHDVPALLDAARRIARGEGMA
ncbi:phosphotransferase family protein [Sphingopyxis sp.]|uniref:phosphotransferase family protein n=1 Tax=Sphingopyxis sp. TaxID=1908224 RepID=UPI002DEF4955|nr:phosphotransferase family protein [Sphingopyxis sp.]